MRHEGIPLLRKMLEGGKMTEEEKPREKPMRFTNGKHPIQIGGKGWQVIKGFFTAGSIIMAILAYQKHWAFAFGSVFFGFFAFNFWWVEYQVWIKDKKLGWGV